MDGFAKTIFTAPVSGKPKTYDIYRIGAGPPVILMQELPGIGEEVIALCHRLADAGFEVWAPHWFGPLGRTDAGNLGRVLCMRREFQIFAKRKSSAIVDWMRALCVHVAEMTGYGRVGVIGMCLSGNFALTLIAEANVWAAVASQPSLAIRARGSLHMSDEEIAASRSALDAKGAMHAYRFEDDGFCTGERFAAIDAAFNDDAVRVVNHVIAGRGHAVLSRHYDDTPGSPTEAAMREVIAYLRQQLGA
ncbi:MAG: dienelactone hydrolase family protein [Hyphomonadaceae bacterium JAD_PAG50586_4]|nr:MAG: dienelactone hydrolase family protein [Hyphomonadaceae bacterium JAD_PAG50586_4]